MKSGIGKSRTILKYQFLAERPKIFLATQKSFQALIYTNFEGKAPNKPSHQSLKSFASTMHKRPEYRCHYETKLCIL